MARVRPFPAWRYATDGVDLSSVTAPPYDVVSTSQRQALLEKNAHNVVRLELPDGPLDPSAPGNRYENGRATWDAWREQGVLKREDTPMIYVLEQKYRLGDREIRRRAFIVEVGLEPFEAGVVLPHERTLPKALGDRFELIKATGANLSQVLALYDDASFDTNRHFDTVTASSPLACATDDDGVVSTLWGSDDAGLAADLAKVMADKQVFIADGHHRYTTALAYRDLRRAQAATSGESTVDPAYDFVMMALVNMDDPDLVVLPTHRVADAPDFDPAAFKEALDRNFVVEPAGNDPEASLAAVSEPALLVKTRVDDAPLLARLRPEVDVSRVAGVEHSAAWQALDVAVLQELILWPLLNIHPDKPETLERLSFVKDAEGAFAATAEHDASFVLRATRMDQLRDVALAGETMPQKSTYFYPKLLSGLLFRSAE